MVELSGGILKRMYDIAQKGFCGYDCQEHAATYAGEHEDDYAEPEFSGKYIDICVKYYHDTQNPVFLARAKTVVESVIENQGRDGYLGMLSKNMRWKNFSVWNQTFTVLGLLSFYEETKERGALDAAEKCARYIAKHFLDNPEEDILDAPNYGTQHISFLYVLPHLYELTGNRLYYDFMSDIVARMKKSDLNFFEFDDILSLQSPKAIENFVVLLGMLRYGRLTGDESAFSGCEKYWRQVRDTQIRNTGNGSIRERWTKNGDAPMLLDASCKPNENCVAVGWLELNLSLFYRSRASKYLDTIEKTLFNHIIGSLAPDGSDFAYYQPNFGKKIFSTARDMYKCCRYRGFTVFAYLKDMLYYADENEIIPMIYQSSRYEDEAVTIRQSTNYPYELTVTFEIFAKKPCRRAVKLRVPTWCKSYTLDDGGKNTGAFFDNGFIVIDRVWDGEIITIALDLKAEAVLEYGVIDQKAYASATYGPLLLAFEDETGGRLDESFINRDAVLQKCEPEDDGIEFICRGTIGGKDAALRLTDYARAGRKDGSEYTVWIPVGS